MSETILHICEIRLNVRCLPSTLLFFDIRLRLYFTKIIEKLIDKILSQRENACVHDLWLWRQIQIEETSSLNGRLHLVICRADVLKATTTTDTLRWKDPGNLLPRNEIIDLIQRIFKNAPIITSIHIGLTFGIMKIMWSMNLFGSVRHADRCNSWGLHNRNHLSHFRW